MSEYVAVCVHTNCSLLQVQPYTSNHSNKEWNGNYGPLRPHAYIPPTVHTHTFTHLSHSSPTHTSAAPHAHTQGLSTHTLLSYPPGGPLTAAHHPHPILPSRPPPPPLLQHSYSLSHPQAGTIVHQVTLGIGTHPHHPGHPGHPAPHPHRILPSPTILPHHQPGYAPHPHQFKPPFPPQPYMASPAAYTGFPLSPTKLSHNPQFSYIWRAGQGHSTPFWRGMAMVNGGVLQPGQVDLAAEHNTDICDDEEKISLNRVEMKRLCYGGLTKKTIKKQCWRWCFMATRSLLNPEIHVKSLSSSVVRATSTLQHNHVNQLRKQWLKLYWRASQDDEEELRMCPLHITSCHLSFESCSENLIYF